jgi:hypothetical protein
LFATTNQPNPALDFRAQFMATVNRFLAQWKLADDAFNGIMTNHSAQYGESLKPMKTQLDAISHAVQSLMHFETCRVPSALTEQMDRATAVLISNYHAVHSER